MIINIIDYMNNPSGKGSNVIPNRQLIKDDFNKRFSKLQNNKKIIQNIYMIEKSYFFHIQIPSEDLEKDMYYDVVIEFYPINKSQLSDFSIKNYGIKMFSNSPSFIYTYGYVYNKNKILSTGSQIKMNDITLSSPPVTRNPNQIISFEKTIYFACLYIMSSNRYTSRMYIETIAKKLDIKKLYNKIKSGDEIEVAYAKASNKKKKNKLKGDKNIVKSITSLGNNKHKKISSTKSTSNSPKTVVSKKGKITGRRKTY